jgi:flagellin
MGQVVAAINAKTADTGVTAFMRQNDAGDYEIEVLSDKTEGTPLGAAPVTFTGMDVVTTRTAPAAGAALVAATDLDTAAASGTDIKGIDTLDVSTQAGAWKAMKKIDSAIDQINASRADLGALQTRFEKSIENIDIMNENISAARGRIVDADFAAETASLSRTQILQQAGTAMVAQANQLSQGVLSLLQ